LTLPDPTTLEGLVVACKPDSARRSCQRLKENVKYPMLNFQYHMKEDNAEIQIKIPVIYCILV